MPSPPPMYPRCSHREEGLEGLTPASGRSLGLHYQPVSLRQLGFDLADCEKVKKEAKWRPSRAGRCPDPAVPEDFRLLDFCYESQELTFGFGFVLWPSAAQARLECLNHRPDYRIRTTDSETVKDCKCHWLD